LASAKASDAARELGKAAKLAKQRRAAEHEFQQWRGGRGGAAVAAAATGELLATLLVAPSAASAAAAQRDGVQGTTMVSNPMASNNPMAKLRGVGGRAPLFGGGVSDGSQGATKKSPKEAKTTESARETRKSALLINALVFLRRVLLCLFARLHLTSLGRFTHRDVFPFLLLVQHQISCFPLCKTGTTGQRQSAARASRRSGVALCSPNKAK